MEGFTWTDFDAGVDGANKFNSKWMPQGIAAFAEDLLAVSWYNDGGNDDGDENCKLGARISLVDLSAPAYRYAHVLLVQPEGSDDFKSLLRYDDDELPGNKCDDPGWDAVHAGGLALTPDRRYLLAANSGGGIRGFDLHNNLYSVPRTESGSGIGVDNGGDGGAAHAAGYRYMLVQSFEWNSDKIDGFSFISNDWTSPDEATLIAGHYKTKTTADSTGTSITTFRMIKGEEGARPPWSLTFETSIELDSAGVYMQGAARKHNQMFLSQSGSVDGISSAALVEAEYLGGSACTAETPCDEGQGDCDNHAECAGGLLCYNRGPRSFAPPGVTFTQSQFDGQADYCWGRPSATHVETEYLNSSSGVACTATTPCAEGQGDCDSDKECAGGLLCHLRDSGDPAPPGLNFSQAIIDGQADYCLHPGPKLLFNVRKTAEQGVVEDLTYFDRNSTKFWSLTEKEGHRVVYSMQFADYTL